jgi:hypothetical protein
MLPFELLHMLPIRLHPHRQAVPSYRRRTALQLQVGEQVIGVSLRQCLVQPGQIPDPSGPRDEGLSRAREDDEALHIRPHAKEIGAHHAHVQSVLMQRILVETQRAIGKALFPPLRVRVRRNRPLPAFGFNHEDAARQKDEVVNLHGVTAHRIAQSHIMEQWHVTAYTQGGEQGLYALFALRAAGLSPLAPRTVLAQTTPEVIPKTAEQEGATNEDNREGTAQDSPLSYVLSDTAGRHPAAAGTRQYRRRSVMG